jgi:hypothetical protein
MRETKKLKSFLVVLEEKRSLSQAVWNNSLGYHPCRRCVRWWIHAAPLHDRKKGQSSLSHIQFDLEGIELWLTKHFHHHVSVQVFSQHYRIQGRSLPRSNRCHTFSFN